MADRERVRPAGNIVVSARYGCKISAGIVVLAATDKSRGVIRAAGLVVITAPHEGVCGSAVLTTAADGSEEAGVVVVSAGNRRSLGIGVVAVAAGHGCRSPTGNVAIAAAYGCLGSSGGVLESARDG